MTEQKFLANIGQRIKELRLRKKMTQHKLAMTCSFEKASMSRIEAGKTNMTLLTLRKVCVALETDINEFFKY